MFNNMFIIYLLICCRFIFYRGNSLLCIIKFVNVCTVLCPCPCVVCGECVCVSLVSGPFLCCSIFHSFCDDFFVSLVQRDFLDLCSFFVMISHVPLNMCFGQTSSHRITQFPSSACPIFDFHAPFFAPDFRVYPLFISRRV